MGSEIAARLQAIRQRIAGAAARRGQLVTLVAVTKTVDLDRIHEAYAAGQRVFGENRVQEGVRKVAAADMLDAEWHLIGHLQSNKARQAVQAFSLIESVDSMRLAARLDDLAGLAARRLPVLLEVNVAGERSKSGFSVEDFWESLPRLMSFGNLELRGLMTVAPQVAEPEEVRWVFRSLRELRDQVQQRFELPTLGELSMGMSDDFEVAVEEGATMVRVGRAIFGERPPHT